MWLLDANVDVHLLAVFKQWGIPCDTAAHRGWKALSNGELVATAFAEGFRCLLTRDQLFCLSGVEIISGIRRCGYHSAAAALAKIPQAVPGGLGRVSDSPRSRSSHSLAHPAH